MYLRPLDWRDSVNISHDKINPSVVFPSSVQTCLGPSMLSGTWIFCYRLFSYLDVPVYPCTTLYVEILEMKIILRVSVQQSRSMIQLVPCVYWDVQEKTSCCHIIETNNVNKSLKRRDAVPQIEGYKQHMQVSMLYFTHCQLSVLALCRQIKVWSFSVLSIRKDLGSLLSS
jgi:hypothetical protein